ncbi:hypothetical protein DH2020_000065 [Rehmannia glutinosa]|uniref:DUF4378 domain-containing protein n=1 Tax=Rehmannia glutinosa TaxID=99300 RepID=A0ABR0XVW8_REHGL
MGKHFRMKHLDDESHDKQPGCIGGLVQVLDYHHWQSNVRKMIQQRKHEDQTHDRFNWSPERKMYRPDAYESEKLLDDRENPYLSTKRSRATKKRSLKSRIKAFVSEEISTESEVVQPNLQRTYSIHHLESLDDDISKICTDWKHPIIVLPRNAESQSLDTTDTDVLEIFKVDKELLIKHLLDTDESIANFSRSALGLNTVARFSKSRSFPVSELSERKKLKPVRLENKQNEVWSFPRENKFQTVNRVARLDRRSSSLNESLGKYARMFENRFQTDAKLNSSKSLRLTSEYDHAPVYFRRIRSLSNVDFYNSNLNSELLRDGPSGNGSVEEKLAGLFASDEKNVSLDANMEIKEDVASDDECEEVDGLKDEAEKLIKADSNCSDIARKQLPDQDFALETEFYAVERRISEGVEHGSSIHDSCFSIKTDDPKTENDQISSDKITKHPKTNNSDMYYVRRILDQSGIATDASDITWHASDQPFGPQLFEQVETCWPHEKDDQQDFCPHHQMLFDLVNEVLVDVYDISLPYYPKALSSSCHVRPFPVGDLMIEEVCTKIGTMVNLETREAIARTYRGS